MQLPLIDKTPEQVEAIVSAPQVRAELLSFLTDFLDFIDTDSKPLQLNPQ